jgi:hypothetical protein
MVSQEHVQDGGEGSREVSGRTVLQVIEGMPDPAEEKARETLSEMGIEDPEPDDWYPQSAWVGTIEAIGERIGRATVQQIGETVVGNIEWPDGTDGFRDGIEVVDRAYRANYRGAGEGGYGWEPAEDGATLVRCRTDHPPAFDEAVVKSTARAFPDEGVSRVVDASDRFDDPPGSVFEVTWWSLGE